MSLLDDASYSLGDLEVLVKTGYTEEDLVIGEEEIKASAGVEPGSFGEPRTRVSKLKRASKRVGWADEVGGSLNSINFFQGDLASSSGDVPPWLDEEGVTAKHKLGNPSDPAFKPRHVESLPSKRVYSFATFPGRGSYKEAVLRRKGPQNPASVRSTKKSASLFWRGRSSLLSRGGKCSRCLASDHRAVNCRDPIRCLACLGIGHRASLCKKFNMQGGRLLNRDRQRRGRPPSVKAYVPYTEEFFRRTELRRKAMLVDVVQPADLGLVPQQTIANALARRFGGYAHDFFVARYRERDFAILHPGCVSAEVLIRRQIITLDNIWLRCFTWGPH